MNDLKRINSLYNYYGHCFCIKYIMYGDLCKINNCRCKLNSCNCFEYKGNMFNNNFNFNFYAELGISL